MAKRALSTSTDARPEEFQIVGRLQERDDLRRVTGLSREDRYAFYKARNSEAQERARGGSVILATPRRMSRARLEEFKIRLIVSTTTDGTAATAMTTVFSVTPSDSGEFASCSALYDEHKCVGGHFDYAVRIKTATASEATACTAVIAYDPVLNSTLGSVANGLQHSQHEYMAIPQNDAVPGQSSLPAKGPLQSFAFKCPEETQRVPATADVVTGQWADTTGSTYDFGYLKLYVEAAVGQTFSIRSHLIMNVLFRSRS